MGESLTTLGTEAAAAGTDPSRRSHFCSAEKRPAAAVAGGAAQVGKAPSSTLDSIDRAAAAAADGAGQTRSVVDVEARATSGAGAAGASRSGPKMKVLSTSGEENTDRLTCRSTLSLKSKAARLLPSGTAFERDEEG